MDEIASSEITFRAGDTVFHEPSGETWTVSAVRDDSLIPAGWPESMAQFSDCEMMEECDDLTHMKTLLRVLSDTKGKSLRHLWAQTNFIDALNHKEKAIIDELYARALRAKQDARDTRREVDSKLEELLSKYRTFIKTYTKDAAGE